MANVYWLTQLQPGHHSMVGGKAFNLGYLLQKGFPVIPGFVISAQVLRDFLETIDWLEPLFADLSHSSLRLDIENPQQLQIIAQQIRHQINTATLSPPLLAELAAAAADLGCSTLILRPSMAMQSNGRLGKDKLRAMLPLKASGLVNIQVCHADQTSLAQGLKRVWADLFGAKSLFYWQRSGIHLQQVNLAVLVQPIQPTIAAGIVQTHDRLIEIQATTGLGMAIDWGDVVPDFYQVQADTGSIQIQQLGQKTIAYRTNSERSDTLTVLQSFFLENEQQERYALEADNLRQVIQLTQAVIAEVGDCLELEWTLHRTPNVSATVSLTQVTPQSTPATRTKSAVFLKPDHSMVKLTETAEIVSQPESTLALATTPIVTGLAASPGQTIALATVISDVEQPLDAIPTGTILIAPTIPLNWIRLLRQVAAIVTEQGGMTSHSAIVARELRIPAVMAAFGATQRIQPGEQILVDGTAGVVYRMTETTPPPALAELTMSKPRTLPLNLAADPSSPTVIGTRLMVNLSQLESLTQPLPLPVDGVGLMRSELLASQVLDGHHPQWWLQQGRESEFVDRMAQAIRQFAATFMPHPVFYRSLDLRSHEFRATTVAETTAPEVNPVLGLRGALQYMTHPALFDLELAALARVQQAGYPNIHLMLPFVRLVDEFTFCRERVERAGLTQIPQFQLWIMAEVPSVLFLLPEYVRAGVQGISIGSNDLTQLLLGIDRDSPQLPAIYNARHPAVQRAIAHLIQQARHLQIPCSICGQAPVQYPELVEDLIREGITAISVEPDAIEPTYQAIVRAERRLLLELARQHSQPEQ
ncbi:putative PEP-binding protein [Pantanalinema sp. GBBB05]|uniref:putative PEP-binding protein n=1 Tax=Pantanalinema sp. GBBB05 TaxID=2604139 RepID=UPI001DCAA8D5|nr:phosphoenolpyruvate synthase [Pantanalinema sp. GBBB05]